MVLSRQLTALDEFDDVGTWNAEENSFILSINVTLGFRPAGGSGEWQTKLG